MEISTINNLPVFDAILTSEQDGMLRISLVDSPAVLTDFLKFAEDKPAQMFAVKDEEKHLVYGCVCRADFPIYRIGTMGEYYIVFKPDTIREMAQKYLREGRQNLVDLEHDGEDVQGVEMVQYFIKDTAKGINPDGFAEVKDGSLFAEFHITDPDIWQKVKDGTYNGFSLEGFFDHAPNTDQAGINEMTTSQKGQFTKTSNTMSKIAKLKEKLAQMLQQMDFANITTDKGVINYEGDDIAVGMEVYILPEDGEKVTAEDGEYKTEDGTTIVVADGKVTDIIAPTEEEPAPAPEAEEQEAPSQDDRLAEMQTLLEAMQARIAELEASLDKFTAIEERLAKLEKAPAVPSAQDELNEDHPVDTKFSKRMDDNLRAFRAARK